MQMQLFGSSILPFTSAKQSIVTNGIANFLGTGVTGSQIDLTVENTIAGVRYNNHCSHDLRSGVHERQTSVQA